MTRPVSFSVASMTAQGVAVIRVAQLRLGVQHQLAARVRAFVVTIKALTPINESCLRCIIAKRM